MEGPNGIKDALASSFEVRELFVTAGSEGFDEVMSSALADGATITEVGPGVMRALTDTSSPQGLVAVVEMPNRSLDDVTSAGDLLLVLAEVRDPGNAGTLLRSASAAGASGVIFTKGAVDPYSPKTVRAASGALFQVPMATGIEVQELVSQLKLAGFAPIGTAAEAQLSMEDADLTGRVALVVGNEAWGIGDQGIGSLDVMVGIPMPGPAESLNVGIAGSILLFEAVRQRRLSSSPR